jgi:hypothetical protein
VIGARSSARRKASLREMTAAAGSSQGIGGRGARFGLASNSGPRIMGDYEHRALWLRLVLVLDTVALAAGQQQCETQDR